MTLDQLVLGRVSGAVLEVGFLFSFGRKQGSSLLEPFGAFKKKTSTLVIVVSGGLLWRRRLLLSAKAVH